MAIDYSQYGATPDIDYSQYGAVPDESNQQQQSGSFLDGLGSYLKSSFVDAPLRMGGDLATGLAQLQHGLINAPHNIVNSISPSIASHIPAQQDQNYFSMYGVQDPTWLDKGIAGAVQYAPYAASGELALGAKGLSNIPWNSLARLASQGLSGSLFGLTQSNNPLRDSPIDAVINAGLGSIAPTVSGAIKGAANYGMDWLSQLAAKGLSKNVISDVSVPTAQSNATAYALAKNNYGKVTQDEQSKWDLLKALGAQADATGNKFDNSGYIDALNNKSNELAQEASEQSGLARKNNPSIQLLQGKPNSINPEDQGYINDNHDTFLDAFKHNTALNADLTSELVPGVQPLPVRTINFAKNNLNDTIQQNITDNGLQNTLGQAWNDARQATQQKNQIFHELVTPKGTTQNSSFVGFLNEKNPGSDPGNFVNDYLPSKTKESVGRMQQFSNMIGDKDIATSIIKKNYFNNYDPNSVISKFNNLNQDEKNYLFSPQENQNIQALSNVLKNNPKALDRVNLGTIFHNALPLVAGGMLGHEGMALGGVLGGNALRLSLSKLFEVPALQKYWSQYLTNPSQSSANPVMQSLYRNLLPSTVLPQSNQGSQ